MGVPRAWPLRDWSRDCDNEVILRPQNNSETHCPLNHEYVMRDGNGHQLHDAMNFISQSFMLNIFISKLGTDRGFRLLIHDLIGNQEGS